MRMGFLYGFMTLLDNMTEIVNNFFDNKNSYYIIILV